MPRILVVSNDYPYPPTHGAAVDMWGRILALRQLGYVVDLAATVRIAPRPSEIEVVRGVVDKLFLLERNRGLLSFVSSTPFQVRSRIGLRNLILVDQYEGVLLESEHVASILQNPSLKASVKILRLHNDESKYFSELSRSSRKWRDRFFYNAEAAKFAGFSPGIKAQCDLLWFISDHERAEHVRVRPEDSCRAFFLPPDPGLAEMQPYHQAQGHNTVFIGTLTLPNNIQGLEWYAERVHPSLSEIEGYSFTIAGRTAGKPLRSLDRLVDRHSNINFSADPEDLNHLYQGASVFINPILRGAGLKIKTIHALLAGLPVVTTSVGVEGTALVDGQHVMVADSPAAFIDAVRQLMNDRRFAEKLVRRAQSFLLRTYNQEHNMRQSLSPILQADQVISI